MTIRHKETAADHSQTPKKNQKRDNNRASDDRLRDLPDWLEEITVPTEMSAPAHNSRESDLEHPVEVETKLRKHSVYIHFGLSADGALAKLYFEQKSLVS